MTRSPIVKRCTPGPQATTSPAISKPGMSAGDPGRRRIEPPLLQQVTAVQTGGTNRDEQLAGAGLGVGVVLQPDLAVDEGDRLHRSPSSQSSSA